MKAARDLLNKYLSDTLYLKIYLILVWFLSEMPVLMPYMALPLRIGMLWGGLCLLWDLCTGRRALRMRYAPAAWGFIVCLLITVLLNWPTEISANLLEVAFTILLLLVMFPGHPSGPDKCPLLREMSAVNTLLCVLTLVASLISLGMFVVQFGTRFEYHDMSYPIGFVEQRLTGIYRNAIYPTALLGLLAAVIQWTVVDACGYRHKGWWRALLIATVVADGCFACLANSRALLVALLAAAALIVCFAVRRLLTAGEGLWPRLRRAAVSLLAAAVACAAIYACFLLVRYAFSYLPAVYERLTAPTTQSGTPTGDGQPIDLERYIPEEYGTLTGRPEIWAKGLRYFAEKPVFGYGPFTLSQTLKLDHSDEPLTHFHNIFVQGLVASGAVGAAFLFFILFGLVFCTARHTILSRGGPYDGVCLCLTALLAFLYVTNLADVTILYMNKLSGCLFWIYAGYALAMMDLDRPARRWLHKRAEAEHEK